MIKGEILKCQCDRACDYLSMLASARICTGLTVLDGDGAGSSFPIKADIEQFVADDFPQFADLVLVVESIKLNCSLWTSFLFSASSMLVILFL